MPAIVGIRAAQAPWLGDNVAMPENEPASFAAETEVQAAIPASLETIAELGKNDQNLVWLDCEMTGLDPEVDRVIEIAIVVTGPHLQPRIEGPVFAIHQSDEQLDRMDAWNKGTHGRSGLIDRVKASSVTEAQAEADIIAFLSRYVPKKTAPMCGNTIGQDRRFLVKYMPKLEAFFHYRNVDVSTLKELSKRWRPEVYNGFKKRQAHTAMADVHESIDELAHYREHFLRLEN
ncbi:MAG TPA: oligoribonuclease [Ramlibacter sp.]|nr:oligoribonuclease [Ramlibacter sp.]